MLLHTLNFEEGVEGAAAEEGPANLDGESQEFFVDWESLVTSEFCKAAA